MRTYSVFEPKTRPDDPINYADSLVFVRHGWSLAALFIPLIWMAIRRLWWAILGYVLLIVGIQLLSFTVPELATAALSVALALIIMIEAGQLRLESMALKGYREIAVLQAKNQLEAEQIFFADWLCEKRMLGLRGKSGPSGGPVLRPSSSAPPPLPGLPS
ncbi:MAG: DUF2628 domain-containing protein [Pseudomonadota bacterium]